MATPRFQAAKNGQRRYVGKTCRACGETLRYTINAACVACTNKNKIKSNDIIRTLLAKGQKVGLR